MKAVIFDMDGVLVDTEPIYLEIARAVAARFGVDVPLDALHALIGIPALPMWESLCERYEIPAEPETLVRVESQAQIERLTTLDRIPTVHGVGDLLAALLADGVPMAIASSSPRVIVDLIVARQGIRPYFGAIISGQDVARGKPAPDIFLKAAVGLGVRPEVCVVIEDSPHGIAGAQAAGMIPIGFVNPGSGNLGRLTTDWRVDSWNAEAIAAVRAFVAGK